MTGCEPVEHAGDHDHRAWAGTAQREQVAQRGALDELHDEVRSHLAVTVGHPDEIVHRDDVGVRDPGERLDLARDAPHRPRVVGQEVREPLDGDLAAEMTVECAEHHPVVPGTDPALQLEA